MANKWEVHSGGGFTKDGFMLLFRTRRYQTTESRPEFHKLVNKLDSSIVFEDQVRRKHRGFRNINAPATSPAHWWPAWYDFGGEIFQVQSIFNSANFFGMACSAIDGEFNDKSGLEEALRELRAEA